MNAKRIMCLGLLTALSWLMTYQLCDASQDSAEDMSACLQIISIHGASLTTPAVPDDDPDADIPTLINHTLLPYSITAEIAIGVSPYSPMSPLVQSLILPEGSIQGLSPPRSWRFLASDVSLHAPQIFVPSARSLAPPLV